MNDLKFKYKKHPRKHNCCRNKINGCNKSDEELFCNRENCENYIGEDNLEFYDEWMEEYYEWRLANETDYERSDEELDDKMDRVWVKFEKQEETVECYSGLFMFEEFHKMIHSRDFLTSCEKQDLRWYLRNEIRDQFKYKITKVQYKNLMEKYMERDCLEIMDNSGWHLKSVFDDEIIS